MLVSTSLKQQRSSSLYIRTVQTISKASTSNDTIGNTFKQNTLNVPPPVIIKQSKNPTHNNITCYRFKSSENRTIATIKKIAFDDVSFSQNTQQLVHKLWSYLLPKGYPHSVRSGYSIFIKGQMLSNILSTAGGVLSMQSLLYAIGRYAQCYTHSTGTLL